MAAIGPVWREVASLRRKARPGGNVRLADAPSVSDVYARMAHSYTPHVSAERVAVVPRCEALFRGLQRKYACHSRKLGGVDGLVTRRRNDPTPALFEG